MTSQVTPSGPIPDPALVIQNMVTKMALSVVAGGPLGLIEFVQVVASLGAILAPAITAQSLGMLEMEARAGNPQALMALLEARRQVANGLEGLVLEMPGMNDSRQNAPVGVMVGNGGYL